MFDSYCTYSSGSGAGGSNDGDDSCTADLFIRLSAPPLCDS